MNSAGFSKCAQLINQAFLKRQTIKPLTSLEGDFTLDQAYQIQREGFNLRVARGEKPIGYKMGFTSKAKMEQMGLHSPIHGELTDAMRVQNGSAFSLAKGIHPKIEPEVVFVIQKKLDGQSTRDEIVKAISHVTVGLEILDSRFEGFKYFSLPDVIADNASAHSFVIGEPVSFDPFKSILPDLEISISINGQVAHAAKCAAILNDPVESVVQLCKMLGERNRVLEAGSLILAGAATQAVALEKGMKAQAKIDKVGEVAVTVAG